MQRPLIHSLVSRLSGLFTVFLTALRVIRPLNIIKQNTQEYFQTAKQQNMLSKGILAATGFTPLLPVDLALERKHRLC